MSIASFLLGTDQYFLSLKPENFKELRNLLDIYKQCKQASCQLEFVASKLC